MLGYPGDGVAQASESQFSFSFLAIASVLLLGAAELASAQRCIRTGCRDDERDERGCCPAPAVVQRDAGVRTVVRPPPACLPGQVRNEDTDNRCCWPGQAWSRERRACVGTPRCPSDRQATERGCECPAGMTDRGDARGHCCWPGQVYTPSQSVCVGPPRCPPRFAVRGGTCVAPPASCPAGMEQSARTQFQCCWPGQSWDPSSGRCTGTISCSGGWARAGTRCIPPAGSCAAGRVASAQSAGQCCWPGQRWDAEAGACTGAPACEQVGWTRVRDQCIAPNRSCPAGQISSASTSNQCCWPGQSWDASAGACTGALRCELNGWTRVRDRCVAPNRNCPEGRVSDASTSFQCCWPGQRWNADAGACAGAPRCEERGWGRVGDRCIPPAQSCEAGRVSVAQSSYQCCWPGQRWDADRGECAGAPTCAEGWARAGTSCRPRASACRDGLVIEPASGQCCWPGQSWNADAARCEGRPSCPAGWARTRSSCQPPPSSACTDGRVATPQSQMQCCWPGQSWDEEVGGCGGTPQCPGDHYSTGSTCERLPSSCPTGQYASQATYGECCWPGQRVSSPGGSCEGAPGGCPPETLPDGEDCSREAYWSHLALARERESRARELARGHREMIVLFSAVLGYGNSSEPEPQWNEEGLLGGALDLLFVAPFTRQGDGSSELGVYGRAHFNALFLPFSSSGGFNLSLAFDAGLAFGPVAIGPGLRMDAIEGGAYSTFEGRFGPFLAAGSPGNNGELGVWAMFHWLPDPLGTSLANVELDFTIQFLEMWGAGVRLRYDQSLGAFRDILMLQAGFSLGLDIPTS